MVRYPAAPADNGGQDGFVVGVGGEDDDGDRGVESPDLRRRVHAVMRDLIKFAGEICGMSVSEMTSMREIHGQYFVARLNRGKVNGHVCLRPAVRLHIRVLGAE